MAVFCLCLVPPCGADDRYLELIDEEVSKVDSVSVDKAVDEGKTSRAEAEAPVARSVPFSASKRHGSLVMVVTGTI